MANNRRNLREHLSFCYITIFNHYDLTAEKLYDLEQLVFVILSQINRCVEKFDKHGDDRHLSPTLFKISFIKDDDVTQIKTSLNLVKKINTLFKNIGFQIEVGEAK